MKPAIVYLAQNSARDRQYGRDSRSLLEKSLALLYQNYNARFQHDILVFHEGDFGLKDQHEVMQGRKEIRFIETHFELPSFLRKEEVPEIWTDGYGAKFSLGYRHMMRFYAVQVFDVLDRLGYDWLLRLDDDSFIHSRIDYDLVEFMKAGGYEYGYRVDVRDAEACSRGFGESVLAYVKAENLAPTFLEDHLRPASCRRQLNNIAKTLLKRAGLARNRPLTPSYQYDLWGYYNNFHITSIGFWKRPEVRAFMRHFDRLGGWYRYRWGDLIFQSAAVQVFMPKEKVYKFTDWTYEHATIKDGKLLVGGIYEGTGDKDSQVVRGFRELYGTTAAGLPCPTY